MHPLNPYRDRKPDFASLATKYPYFKSFVKVGQDGYGQIDFQDPRALRALTKVLLKEDWQYDVDMREDRLCPTIANRLDYLLSVLDIEPYLQTQETDSEAGSSKNRRMKVLDIGTGHLAIYPLLVHRLRPSAHVVGTELDEVSFHHALQTRQKNSMPSDHVSLLRPNPDQPILFPIFESLEDGKEKGKGKAEEQWDIVVCNPPFYGSEEEMEVGIRAKETAAHAAATAASNELITPGGEVRFVGQMIGESIRLGEICSWYTSLIGKYASLAPLVDILKSFQVDNYFIKILKQSRTTRWILGWSLGKIRLPDVITRPDDMIPGTSFAKLLPLPNTFSHVPDPAMASSVLHTKVNEILKSVQLIGSDDSSWIATSEGLTLSIKPQAVTWSRAARRQTARDQGEKNRSMAVDAESDEKKAPLFIAEIRISSMKQSNSPSGAADHKQDVSETSDAGPPSRVDLIWREGRNRDSVDALWKFLLTKAGLIRGR